jgi:hypothetical protein
MQFFWLQQHSQEGNKHLAGLIQLTVDSGE